MTSRALIIMILCWTTHVSAVCTTPAGVTGEFRWITPTMKVCDGSAWIAVNATTLGTCGGVVAGTFKYDSGSSAAVFCNGTNWISMKGGFDSACTALATGKIIYEASSGRLKFCDGTSFYIMAQGTADPCAGAPAMGTMCSGVMHVGVIPATGDNYMVMPGGCDGTTTNPTCNLSSTDGAAVQKQWQGALTATGATNTTQGQANIVTLIGLSADLSAFAAAKYCHDMTYAGFSDWFLPSQDELDYIRDNKTAFENLGTKGAFYTGGPYWTSTEDSASPTLYAKVIPFNLASINNGGKTGTTTSVRCVRKIP